MVETPNEKSSLIIMAQSSDSRLRLISWRPSYKKGIMTETLLALPQVAKIAL